MKDESNQAPEQWLESFMVLYNQTSPLIDIIAKFSDGGEPAEFGSLFKASRSLEPLSQSLKEMPNPPQKELRHIKNDLEKTLSMCLKAGKMVTKTIEDLKRGSRFSSRMHFKSIAGYASYAEIYHKALVKRLAKISD